MIELNKQQRQALKRAEETPVRVINPDTHETYVLLPAELYERIKESLYDDSPWTDEERDILAWEAGQTAGWEDMGEYDRYPIPRGKQGALPFRIRPPGAGLN